MIDDESIARFGHIAEATADLVHLRRQRPDMQRLRDPLCHQAASVVEDGEGEILAFLDDGGITRAQHVEREFARDLQGRLINDFEVDGVQIGAPRHPNSSYPRTRTPGDRRSLAGEHRQNLRHHSAAYFTGYVRSSCTK